MPVSGVGGVSSCKKYVKIRLMGVKMVANCTRRRLWPSLNIYQLRLPLQSYYSSLKY